MRLVVEPMELEDISQVLEVDRESYTLPWPASAYRREVLHNRNARYVVLRDVTRHAPGTREGTDHRTWLPWPFMRRTTKEEESRSGQVLGYAGMWLMVDEAHITTIAVRTAFRGQGLGEVLLASMVELASQLHAQRVTLEVRVSNSTAQNLYRKYGFTEQGIRPRYYSDNNEDAYIMTTDDIQSPAYRRRFDELVDALRRRVDRSDLEVQAPAFPEAQHHATREAE